MKVIAETIGQIELMDSVYREVIPWDRPAAITWSNFWESRTGKGQIKILHSNLPDAASDQDFLEFLKESENKDLAIASFVSQFEEGEEEQTERDLLEARAKELNVSFRANISDEKLAERIEEAEKAEE